jgi:hypothetical protein
MLEKLSPRRGILKTVKTAKELFDARPRAGVLAVSAGVARIATMLSVW